MDVFKKLSQSLIKFNELEVIANQLVLLLMR